MQRELGFASWAATLVGSRALELYYRKPCLISDYRSPGMLKIHFFGSSFGNDEWVDIAVGATAGGGANLYLNGGANTIAKASPASASP